MSRCGRQGFTLVELMVVIAIIAVLAGILVPVSARITQSSKATSCVSHLGQLGAALNLYLGDHNEMMPVLQAGRASINDNVAVIDNTLNTYASDPGVFVCPGDTQGIAAKTGTSYYWNNAINGQSATHLHFFLTNGQNSQIPVILDKEGFHPYAANKVNVLYADGHASQDLKFMTGQ